MQVRLGEVAMVPDDFRSTDTVRFPASLNGFRKHFLDIARVLDTTDIDFRCHSIRGMAPFMMGFVWIVGI